MQKVKKQKKKRKIKICPVFPYPSELIQSQMKTTNTRLLSTGERTRPVLTFYPIP